ncbi:MAG: alpha-isopropylmalate synthase regulatory domain-containing protein [Candidatus Egerieousia sp.]
MTKGTGMANERTETGFIEVLDTTLRDGEQTAGVSFNVDEKLAIARLLLEELKVNRIEVGSARVSNGEHKALDKICDWASTCGHLENIETLGFVDGGLSVEWICESGGKVMNLLTKGSIRHLKGQLGKTSQEHISDILKCIDKAVAKGLDINIYLEDWSNGMISSPEHVFYMIDCLKDAPIKRFMLPDTLGILNPDMASEFCRTMRAKYPSLHFDFHAHNDYDMAAANTFEAIKAGFNGIHTTVNGLGERTGNLPVSSAVGILNDLTQRNNSLNEKKLYHVCKYVETISGVRIPANKPLVGDLVFTQTSGVHADGDRKDNLYSNALLPERFGRTRKYALGKTSGKANIMKNLEKLGIRLSNEQMKLVTERVVELGDKKENLNAEDLPFIIADVLKGGYSATKDNIHIVNYSLQLARGMRPVATLRIKINGKEYEEISAGDGQYDAFMKALWKIYDKLGKKHPVLTDYQVNIPPGGKTYALVETTISWNNDGHELTTRGIDSDQTEAAIKATVKMLNIIENIDMKKLTI